jgi:RNA polymerase sigma factor (sigma-70 family)
MSRSVRDITTAIASGNPEAFAQFYRQWFDVVFAEARNAAGSKGRDEQFCLDTVQETMMRVIRSIKPMDSEAAVHKWLRVVVQSCCYDHFRSQARRSQREAIASASRDHSSDTRELNERIEWLHQQLISLDADDAHLLTLRFRLGWTLQRIGRSLGLKPGAVDGRISRALAGLRRNAREDFNDS